MGRDTFYHTKAVVAIDWFLLVLLVCLSSWGLFLLLSLDRALFFQQFIFILLGLVLFFIAARLDATLLWWSAPYLYVFVLILLAASYLGPEVRGATRWIAIGGMQIQPSEIVKPLLFVVLARLVTQFPPRNMKFLPLHAALFLIPFLLVVKQPDLGTGLVYASTFLAMTISGGFSFGLFVTGVVGSILFSPLLWRFLAPYQQQRVLTFLSPGLDPSGAGYNAIQAMIAVGSGQWWGRGLGRGTQSHLRFLPEHHTDFIFATLIEELGLIGGLLLLVLFALLLWRIIVPIIRGQIDHPFPFAYTIGVFTMILTQVFINSGMNMGLIPITGITLPFISYGGSSILSLYLSLGLLSCINRSWGKQNPLQ